MSDTQLIKKIIEPYIRKWLGRKLGGIELSEGRVKIRGGGFFVLMVFRQTRAPSPTFHAAEQKLGVGEKIQEQLGKSSMTSLFSENLSEQKGALRFLQIKNFLLLWRGVRAAMGLMELSFSIVSSLVN